MEEVKNYSKGLIQTSEHLMEMVNKLMDFSKLRSGNMEINPRPVVLTEILNSKLNGQRLMAEGKGLDFLVNIDAAIPPRMVLDPMKLGQVVLNLVSNSIKFTNTGYVSLTVTLLKQTELDVHLHFSVEDTGIGISEEHLEKIFNPFYQGNIEAHSGGTGLGLTISSQLVEALGGKLVVESQLKKGSKFSFTIVAPIDKQEDIEPGTLNSWESLKGLKILLAEDCSLNQMIVRKFLEDKEITCTSVSNGAIALELITQQDFDLVLTDLKMPRLEGCELLEKLRASKHIKHQNLPVIALTGSLQPREGEALKELGFSDYILKPFKPEKLFASILEQVRKL
ncbi:MAG: ATP-binding protein, partial [Gillisia sp.]